MVLRCHQKALQTNSHVNKNVSSSCEFPPKIQFQTSVSLSFQTGAFPRLCLGMSWVSQKWCLIFCIHPQYVNGCYGITAINLRIWPTEVEILLNSYFKTRIIIIFISNYSFVKGVLFVFLLCLSQPSLVSVFLVYSAPGIFLLLDWETFWSLYLLPCLSGIN